MNTQLINLRSTTQFTGLTDKYAYRRFGSRVLLPNLEDAGFIDVIGSHYYDEFWKESMRDRRFQYQRYYRFYLGEHWDQPMTDGELKPVRNFCESVVNRTVDFFMGREPFTFVAQGENGDMAEYFNMIWEDSNKELLTMKLAKNMCTFGDAYVMVMIVNSELPRSEWRFRLMSIDPMYCYPKWRSDGSQELESILIQFPWKNDSTSENLMYSMYITDEKFKVYHGETLVKTEVNTFGKVPVVHIPNEHVPGKNFGMSDLEQVIPLNEEFNDHSFSVKKIIKYHAEPTTLIYGIRASALEKSANQIWSNLPMESKVENLELKADLKPIYNYLEQIENAIYRTSGVPKLAFEVDRGISNASGISLEIIFQPLIDKVRRKRIQFEAAAKRINHLVLLGLRNIFEVSTLSMDDIQSLLGEVKVKFHSALPRDTVAELDAAAKRLQMGITSVAYEIRRNVKADNPSQLISELLADRIYKLNLKLEEIRALGGVPANPSVVTTDSLGLMEDVAKLGEDLRLEYETILKEIENEEKPDDDNPNLKVKDTENGQS